MATSVTMAATSAAFDTDVASADNLDGNNNADNNTTTTADSHSLHSLHHNFASIGEACKSEESESRNGDAKSTSSSSPTTSSLSNVQYRQTLGYLEELLNEREKLKAHSYSNTFAHVNRLLEEEIQKIRASLIHINGANDQKTQLELPEPSGPIVQRSRKLFVPIDKYPDMNFIGRIIGPRGLTIRELEVDCGCKLYIRGRGSLRDKEKETKCRGQPNWEHLSEELHVLICAEDTEKRAEARVEFAAQRINKLIESVIANEDDFKKRQLAELAMLNDKFKLGGVGMTGAKANSPPLGTALLPPDALSMVTAAGLLAPLYQAAAAGGAHQNFMNLQQQQQHQLHGKHSSSSPAGYGAHAYLSSSIFSAINPSHLLAGGGGGVLNPYGNVATGNPLFDVSLYPPTSSSVNNSNMLRYQPYPYNQSYKKFKK